MGQVRELSGVGMRPDGRSCVAWIYIRTVVCMFIYIRARRRTRLAYELNRGRDNSTHQFPSTSSVQKAWWYAWNFSANHNLRSFWHKGCFSPKEKKKRRLGKTVWVVRTIMCEEDISVDVICCFILNFFFFVFVVRVGLSVQRPEVYRVQVWETDI